MVDNSLTESSERQWIRLLPLGLVVVGVITYVSTLNNDFIFDDEKILKTLRGLTNWGETTTWLLSTRRALVNFTFVLNHQLEAEQVRFYHLVNILVHVIVALVLFGVIRRTLLLEPMRSRFERASRWLAFSVALIWLVHPLNTQSVSYIIQRGESIMGMFYLLTMYGAIRLLESPPKQYRWLAGTVAACAAGMACKEVMFTAPIMVIVYDWVFTRWTLAELLYRRSRLYLLLLATWVWYPIAGFKDMAEAGYTTGLSLAHVQQWQYALTQPLVILKYFCLCVWPHDLVLDYSHYLQHTRFLFEPRIIALGNVIWPVFLVLLLLVMTIWGLAKRHALGFVGAWFFGILSVTSSFLAIADVMVEHRMYLSLAAVVVLAVVPIYLLLDKIKKPTTRWILATALVLLATIVLAGLTIQRNHEYETKLLIWKTVVKRRPTNPRGWHNYGSALSDAGKNDQAMYSYEQALALKPDHHAAFNNLGNIYLKRGQIEKAIEKYRRAVELDPLDPEYHHNLGSSLLRVKDLAGTEQSLLKAIELRENYAKAHNNLGLVRALQNRTEEASKLFHKTIELDPDLADPWNNLTKIHLDQNNIVQARKCLAEAQRIHPIHLTTIRNQVALAKVYATSGQFDEAIKLIGDAIDAADLADESKQRITVYRQLLKAYRDGQMPAPSALIITE